MVTELQAIHLHLWIITGLLSAIFLVAGYCNYSRINEKKAASPYKHLKDLWEREKFAELRDFTTNYLKMRPNTAEVLSYHAMVLLHFKDYAEARRAAEKMGSAAPELRESALRLVDVINAEATS